MSNLKYLQLRKFIPVIAVIFCCGQTGYTQDIEWEKWPIDSSGNGADGVDTADINGDGRLDVVSGWEQSGEIKLYINPGRHRVRGKAAWSATEISYDLEIKGIEDAAFADLNLDGSVETIISSIEGDTKTLGIHWLQGQKFDDPKNWRAIILTPGESAGYMKARAAQIDGVGAADIVAGTRNLDGEKAGIYWFKSPQSSAAGHGHGWQRFFIGELNFKTVTLVIKDMDADGAADIVYSGRTGVGWFKNPGPEALGDHPEKAYWERIVISPTGSEFVFCDLDIDGDEDIVTATSKRSAMVAIWLERLDDTGRNWAAFPIASDDQRPGKASGEKFVLKGVACGFVDGDEKIDLVFTASGRGNGVFMMTPRAEVRTSEPWELRNLTHYTDDMKYDNLRLVDIDGDRDLDIITTEEGEGIFSAGEGVLWFENPLYAADSDLPEANAPQTIKTSDH